MINDNPFFRSLHQSVNFKIQNKADSDFIEKKSYLVKFHEESFL